MKATGIVRRIDDLGRVVIPKEIRRTLKIREGDPLEIYTDNEGEVILKKYSPIGEMGAFAKEYAETLHQVTGHTIIITDRDRVIAVAGASKKDYMDKPLSQELERVMDENSIIVVKSESDMSSIPIVEGDTTRYTAQIVSPILSEGSVIGSVIMCSTQSHVIMGDSEYKLVQAATSFFGKQLEQ
ncbi:stage V sporulation protein T [Anaerocellum diazotrophicum]|uniref:AbrB family transcriptional regulator n=1 Tax=Caldicellulosiruptor diazotrophicus TaxID=2806205 RepID=A0ABM7NN30_9FIRM|nr:stage V sporulation protein T [Caldicellulosiruptor diazotrophicus]BCS81536.1 AbrB family transcriptional regulator [Caldicellulosiruptor diazotrophicus]